MSCAQLSCLNNVSTHVQDQLNSKVGASTLNDDTRSTVNLKLWSYDTTSTSKSKLVFKKLDVDIYTNTLKTINITGNGALLMWESNQFPELSLFNDEFRCGKIYFLKIIQETTY